MVLDQRSEGGRVALQALQRAVDRVGEGDVRGDEKRDAIRALKSLDGGPVRAVHGELQPAEHTLQRGRVNRG